MKNVYKTDLGRGRVGPGVERRDGVHEVLEHLSLHELTAEELGAWNVDENLC